MPVLVFKLPAELNEMLEIECKRTGLRRAELLRHIILAYFKEEGYGARSEK